MIRRYPSLSLTLWLALILIPPFLISSRYRELEPYPAILLPTGATKIQVGQKDVRFIGMNLWGKRKRDQSWTKIDAEKLIDPIPIHFLAPIIGHRFGLELANGHVYKLPRQLSLRTNKVTASEAEQGKQWLRQRLASLGYGPDRIKVSYEEKTFHVETQTATQTKQTHAEIIRLD